MVEEEEEEAIFFFLNASSIGVTRYSNGIFFHRWSVKSYWAGYRGEGWGGGRRRITRLARAARIHPVFYIHEAFIRLI